jgi:hypothetical protein
VALPETAFPVIRVLALILPAVGTAGAFLRNKQAFPPVKTRRCPYRRAAPARPRRAWCIMFRKEDYAVTCLLTLLAVRVCAEDCLNYLARLPRRMLRATVGL